MADHSTRKIARRRAGRHGRAGRVSPPSLVGALRRDPQTEGLAVLAFVDAADGDLDGPAAHRAVLGVALLVAAALVHPDRDGLAAVRAGQVELHYASAGL